MIRYTKLLFSFLFFMGFYSIAFSEDDSTNATDQGNTPESAPYEQILYPHSFFRSTEADPMDDPFTRPYFRAPLRQPFDLERGRRLDYTGPPVEREYIPEPVKYYTYWDDKKFEGAGELSEEAFNKITTEQAFKVTFDRNQQLKKVEEYVMGLERSFYLYQDPRYLALTGYGTRDQDGEYELLIFYDYNEFGQLTQKKKYSYGTLVEYFDFSYQQDRIIKKRFYTEPTVPPWMNGVNTYLSMLHFPEIYIPRHFSCRQISFDDAQNPIQTDYYIRVELENRRGDIFILHEGVLIGTEKTQFLRGKAVQRKFYSWEVDSEDEDSLQLLKYWIRDDSGKIEYFNGKEERISWRTYMWITSPMHPDPLQTSDESSMVDFAPSENTSTETAEPPNTDSTN
jgi:hypothetical protein